MDSKFHIKSKDLVNPNLLFKEGKRKNNNNKVRRFNVPDFRAY